MGECWRNECVREREKERLKWAKQMTEALVWIHGRGMVHCDVSSANTIITESWDEVICDFSSLIVDGVGIVERGRCSRWYKFLGAEEGTEREREREEYSIRNDLWALVTVCHEMWVRRIGGDLSEEGRVEWADLEDAGSIGKGYQEMLVGWVCWCSGSVDGN